MNRIGNLYHKKIDTSLYKKVFFNNFKELCLTLFPQYKNFSNEKYLNFKNIYHKIYHATKDLREATETTKNEFQNLGKKANEIRKINHKNNIIRLIIQKLEGQPFKPKDNNIFKQVSFILKKVYLILQLDSRRIFQRDQARCY